MAKWIVADDIYRTGLDRLDDAMQRKIRRTMVENGAKVLVKEMQASIESRHHVVNSYMKDAVAATKVYETAEETSIEVYPQGYDPRGVSNEMKLQIINYGFYHRASGKRQLKKDFFLGEKFRKRCEPRIRGVMNYTFQLFMEELNK